MTSHLRQPTAMERARFFGSLENGVRPVCPQVFPSLPAKSSPLDDPLPVTALERSPGKD